MWELGTTFQQYIKSLQTLNNQGVEERLKQIRETTFKRMADHPNNSLTWAQIQAAINRPK
jgi:hypothetical protein